MLKAHDENGNWIFAWNTIRGNTYRCPKCGELLSVVVGSRKVIDHFRHHPMSSCTFGAGESVEHITKKFSISAMLQHSLGADNVRMEHRLDDGQRPDVYFETADGQGVAVEIQHSPISDKDLADRTASYANKSIAALWLIDDIRSHLNSVGTDDRHALSRLPLWQRRVAGLTGDVAFDFYTGSDDVVSIKLKLEQDYVRDGAGRIARDANDMPMLRLYWPTAPCILHVGDVWDDKDDHGYLRKLWVPKAKGGSGSVVARPVRRQERREIADVIPGMVECDREPIGIIRTDGASEFDAILRKFWSGVGAFYSLEDRMRLWGYK